MRWFKNDKRLEKQMGEGFRWLSHAMKAGLSLEQSIISASQELDPPLSEIFSEITAKIKRGYSLDEALQEEARRLNLQDFSLFVSSVVLLRPLGGNFVAHFENLARILESRQRIHSKAQIYTTQGYTQGIFLVLLPFFLGAALYFISPEWMSLLWKTSLGGLLLMTILFLDAIGWIWIRKIIRVQL